MKKAIPAIMIASALSLASCTQVQTPESSSVEGVLTAEEISAARFTPEVMWKMGRLGEVALSPDAAMAVYTVTRYDMQKNSGTSVLYLHDMATGDERPLTDASSNASSPQWSSNSKRIYFLSDRSGSMQVWSMNPDGGDVRQVSDIHDGIDAYGVDPTGQRLFFTKKVQAADRRSSDIYKDMDKSQARIYDDLMCRHWNYWDEGMYSHIFIAEIHPEGLVNQTDILGEDAAWDAPLAPYFDATEITWNPDGTKLAYTCKKLTGTAYAVSTDSDIYVYDTADGSTVNINKPMTGGAATNPASPAVDMAEAPGYDRYPVWSPDGTKIAFRSMATPGYESDKDRLFIYDTSSQRMTDLTENFDHSAQNVVWSDNAKLLFISAIEGTQQICSVAIPESGNGADVTVDVLTKGDHHISSFCYSNGKCVATIMTISRDNELFAMDLAGGTSKQITFVNKEIYDNIRMGEVQKRWVTTTDGKQMLTWVILPPDFDPAKKYPTLLYCEGGPQSTITNGWSYRWNFQLMAAQGYVVVAPNRRGCPSFGSEWREQISGDYSGQNIKDYLAAIDDVAREPWCDTDHMGCVGASYGGYSVYYLAGHHEGRFKAFISHCGIFDFESMYGQTEELFFINHDYGGPYWDKENATAMRSYENSPHNFVDKWDTPIMIITGEFDFRIPYTQSLEAFTAARLKGLDARLVEFQNEGHQVFKPQNSMVWNREFFGWLDKYLKE
ncbi:MAG: S9 family peptidase [Alistipes sp.]|nr:S9 family peptidase [Alistipes sp.]